MKVKIFYEWSGEISNLQGRMNNWLEEINPDIYEIKTAGVNNTVLIFVFYQER